MIPLSLAIVALALTSAELITLPLWPEGTPTPLPPKSEATAKLIERYGGATATRLTDISEPEIAVYRPEKPNGTCVVVAPGGGYMFLSSSFEGTEVCEWLQGIGVTGVLLKYRTPTRDAADPFELPVQDGQRALGVVRKHAAEWNIDPARVGLLGFSAGANLAGHCAWDRTPRTYPQHGEYDDPRGPDFLIFIYGGGFLDHPDAVPPDAPPAFFLVAHDDKSAPAEAAQLYLGYQKYKLPAELHIYGQGGHGFGMRRRGMPVDDWPKRCEEWLRSLGLLTAK